MEMETKPTPKQTVVELYNHQQHGFPISPMSAGQEINRPPEIQSHMVQAGFR
jgi:hypothetical protein